LVVIFTKGFSSDKPPVFYKACRYYLFMIDISHKHSTLRYAKAQGVLITTPDIIDIVNKKNVPKGDLFQVARAAGIQAAKRTSEWIVFCHNFPVDWIDIKFEAEDDRIHVIAEGRTTWKTGLEMEVMTAVSAALLNMYDMLKPLDEKVELGMIRLIEKRGGKSDYMDKLSERPRAALILASDAVFNGRKADRTTNIVRGFLEDRNMEIMSVETIQENEFEIENKLMTLADSGELHFIFTMGSTGVGENDIMPEVTKKVIQTEIPGLSEGMREHGRQRIPYAMFSRGVCGIRNRTIIINLPGSSRGAEESLNALFPGLEHILLSTGILRNKKAKSKRHKK
jgi:cyclic pyranopterin monophosphate synthase